MSNTARTATANTPMTVEEYLAFEERAEVRHEFIRYKNIESLRNYILVDSEKKVVEVRVKGADGAWEATSFVEAYLRFPVPALGVELAFQDVYEGVTFGKS